MVEDYVKDKQLMHETRNGSKWKKITAGVAQGHVLRTELWDISYDDIVNYRTDTISLATLTTWKLEGTMRKLTKHYYADNQILAG